MCCVDIHVLDSIVVQIYSLIASEQLSYKNKLELIFSTFIGTTNQLQFILYFHIISFSFRILVIHFIYFSVAYVNGDIPANWHRGS